MKYFVDAKRSKRSFAFFFFFERPFSVGDCQPQVLWALLGGKEDQNNSLYTKFTTRFWDIYFHVSIIKKYEHNSTTTSNRFLVTDSKAKLQ